MELKREEERETMIRIYYVRQEKGYFQLKKKSKKNSKEQTTKNLSAQMRLLQTKKSLHIKGNIQQSKQLRK